MSKAPTKFVKSFTDEELLALPTVIGTGEVAMVFGVCENTVHRLVSMGQLPSLRLAGKVVRYSRDAVFEAAGFSYEDVMERVARRRMLQRKLDEEAARQEEEMREQRALDRLGNPAVASALESLIEQITAPRASPAA